MAFAIAPPKKTKKQTRKARARTVGARPKEFPSAKKPNSFQQYTGYNSPTSNQNQNNNIKSNGNNNNSSNNDDVLGDLFGFGSNGTSNGTSNTNGNSGNNTVDDSNPFEIFGFDDEKKTDNNKVKQKPKKPTPTPPKKPAPETPPAIKKNGNQSNGNQSNGNGYNSQPLKAQPKSNTKQIDILPLMHRGIKGNKFKFNASKSKIRLFYVTNNNQYFCWEAIGPNQKLKSKKPGNNGKKIDPDRSIPFGNIRGIQKNSANLVQHLTFIPAQNKSLTLTIIYTIKGSNKKLNFMLYEPFHHALLYRGLNELVSCARNINRSLDNMYELYVDFPKQMLPKHLRPQKFKWEPLQPNNNNNNNNNDTNNDININSVEIFDPFKNDPRNRIKSF